MKFYFTLCVVAVCALCGCNNSIHKALIGSNSQPDLENVMDRPVSLGANDAHTDGLTLSHDSKPQRTVYGCREYITATQNGFYARTTFDMTMESFFTNTCAPLIFLNSAQDSKYSRFQKPYFKKDALSQLPSQMGLIFQMSDDPFCLEVTTLAQCLTENLDGFSLQRTIITDNAIDIKATYDNGGWEIIAKGDINHDGWEDIMLSTYHTVTQGSYRAYGTQCLEWTTNQQTPSIIDCTP